MKKAIYDTLEQIPEADRGDYKLVTEAGSPNLNKYVLDLDPSHPVAMKNTELLSEKSQRDAAQAQAVQTAVAAKDAEIQRINAELAIAKTQTGLPAGQVAVAAADALLIGQFKGLGEFDEVKKKVEEHAALKEQTEAVTRKTLFSDAAKAHNLDPDAFTALAEQRALHERLEMREVPDPKKPSEKVKHYFVKGKNADGTDTSASLGDFVKSDDFFKPFLASLTAKQENGGGRRIPEQGVGDVPKDQSVAKVFINKTYKRPDEKKAA